MVFSDYINSLSTEKESEKGRTINMIADACCKTVTVVYNWAAGRTTPSALDRKVISGVLNVPESELFPDVK